MQPVVVTGLGIVSPLGLDVESTWRALLDGRSGVGPITLFDASDFPVQVAAEVKGFEPAALLDARAARRLARYEVYDELDCEVQTWKGPDAGDSYSRFICRFNEMRESCKLILEALAKMPKEGAYRTKPPRRAEHRRTARSS